MKPPPENDLITITEAAHILGFKQRSKLDILIKNGFLKIHHEPGIKKTFLSRKEVFNLPNALPVPPPPELIHK